MGLLVLFKHSVYSPEFYRELLQKPFRFSLKYFYSVVIVLAIFITVSTSTNLVPAVRDFFDRLGPAVLAAYPDELVVTIQNGEASANVTQPYFIPVPDKFKDYLASAEEKDQELPPKNLIVIDTGREFTPEAFKTYDTFVLLTRHELVVKKGEGDLQVRSLAKVPSAKIDKNFISTLVDKLDVLKGWVAPLLVFGIFLLFLVIYSGNLVYLFVLALPIWLLAKTKKVPLGYLQAYQVGLHATSLSLVLSTLTTLFPPKIPYLFSVFALVIAWINLSPAPAEQAALPAGGV